MIHYLIVIIAGLVAGLYNVMAGGGSLITWPALRHAGLDPHIATATNRFAITFLSFGGALRYWMEGKVKKEGLVPATLAAALGSVPGAFLVLSIDKSLVNRIITAIIIALAVLLLLKRNNGSSPLPGEEKERKGTLFFYPACFFLGLYGGFFGANVSTLIIALLVATLGISYIESAAMTTIIVAALSVTSSVVFILKGAVDFSFGIPLAAASARTTP